MSAVLHAHGGHGHLHAEAGVFGGGDGLHGVIKALGGHAHRDRQHACPRKGGGGADEQDIRLGVVNGGQLNDVHLQLFQLAADLNLFLEAEGAVLTAQGTVGDSHGNPPYSWNYQQKNKNPECTNVHPRTKFIRGTTSVISKRDHLIGAHQLLCLVTGQTGETYFFRLGLSARE